MCRKLGSIKEALQEFGIVFLSVQMKRIYSIGKGFFVRHRMKSAVKRVELVSYGMLYIVKRSLLRYHCFECACTNCEEN